MSTGLKYQIGGNDAFSTATVSSSEDELGASQSAIYAIAESLAGAGDVSFSTESITGGVPYQNNTTSYNLSSDFVFSTTAGDNNRNELKIEKGHLACTASTSLLLPSTDVTSGSLMAGSQLGTGIIYAGYLSSGTLEYTDLGLSGKPVKIYSSSGGGLTATFSSDNLLGVGISSPEETVHISGRVSSLSTAYSAGVQIGGASTGSDFSYISLRNISSTSGGTTINFSYEGDFFKGKIAHDNATNIMSLYTNGVSAFYIDGSQSVFMPYVYSDGLAGTYRDLYIKDNGQLLADASDRDLKEDINDLINFEWFYQLRPVSFNWKSNKQTWKKTKPKTKEKAKFVEYGLIAQEVAEIAPEMCGYSTTGNAEFIYRNKMQGVMIKVIQEQKKQIDALEKRIEELEK